MNTQQTMSKSQGTRALRGRIGAIILILALLMSMPTVAFAAEYLGNWTLNKNTRIAGTDRYGTSDKAMEYLISNYIKDPVNFVVASGANFPDALSGAFLANEKDAPLVLTSRSKDREVLEKIKSKVKNPAESEIFLLGGTGAVSQEFEDMAKEAGFKVTRLGGTDRYGTNLAILNEIEVEYTPLLVCSGKSYADALSASAVDMPIMLVNEKQLTSQQKAILGKEKNRLIYVIGGTAAVNSAIENELKSYGTVRRVAGGNRYETSYAIANQFFQFGLFSMAKGMVFAYGQNFPDGLVAGPIAMREGMPILLVNSKNYLDARQFAESVNPDKTITVGGTGVIPEATIKKIMAAETPQNLLAWQQKAYDSAGSIQKKVISSAYSQASKNVNQNCHQLVVNAYRAAGIEITDAYRGIIRGTNRYFTKTQNPVPGDIIVYNNHVAIYVGKNANGTPMAVHGGWYGNGGRNETVVWTVYVSTGTVLYYWHIK